MCAIDHHSEGVLSKNSKLINANNNDNVPVGATPEAAFLNACFNLTNEVALVA